MVKRQNGKRKTAERGGTTILSDAREKHGGDDRTLRFACVCSSCLVCLLFVCVAVYAACMFELLILAETTVPRQAQKGGWIGIHYRGVQSEGGCSGWG